MAESGTTFVYRNTMKAISPKGESMEESIDAVYAFKQRIKPQLKDVPYIDENVPVVCTWYPSAHAVLLWNLGEEKQPMTLIYKDKKRQVEVSGLGTALVENLI